MKYQTNKFILVFGILAMIFASGCNEDEFLTRYDKSEPSPENFFVDEVTARMAVNACQHDWLYGGALGLSRDMTIVLDAMTDDSYWRPARNPSIALTSWNINPTNNHINTWWNMSYRSINAANFAIDNIPNSSDPNFTPEKQAPFIAEAKFFRAYNYFFLTSLFGDVPLWINTEASIENFAKPRTPKSDVLKQVITDLEDAIEDLPATPTAIGAPGKAAAAALLAKTYLVTQEWSKAEVAARNAIQIAEGAGHGLMDDYLSIWSEEGNKELLFYWSYVKNSEDYGQNATVQRLSRLLPAELRIAINGDGWGYCLPQRSLFDAFEENDPRREFTLYYPGSNYEIYPGPNDFTYEHQFINEEFDTLKYTVTYTPGDMVEYDYRWSETGINVRKMTRSLTDLGNVRWDGMDIPVIRMAELYLVLAEALAEQGNAEALDWVNKVRKRPSVNLPDKTAADGTLRDIVRQERRVELSMEGLRIFDLIRWDVLGEAFGDGTKVKRHFYSDNTALLPNTRFDNPVGDVTRKPVFPTPQTELDNNPEINTQIGDW
jgi:starch-binding outer membrane protein, SusD/RagB family